MATSPFRRDLAAVFTGSDVNWLTQPSRSTHYSCTPKLLRKVASPRFLDLTVVEGCELVQPEEPSVRLEELQPGKSFSPDSRARKVSCPLETSGRNSWESMIDACPRTADHVAPVLGASSLEVVGEDQIAGLEDLQQDVPLRYEHSATRRVHSRCTTWAIVCLDDHGVFWVADLKYVDVPVAGARVGEVADQ